jgi:hypothetical protein
MTARMVCTLPNDRNGPIHNRITTKCLPSYYVYVDTTVNKHVDIRFSLQHTILLLNFYIQLNAMSMIFIAVCGPLLDIAMTTNYVMHIL